jgi:hypothetical protein
MPIDFTCPAHVRTINVLTESITIVEGTRTAINEGGDPVNIGEEYWSQTTDIWGVMTGADTSTDTVLSSSIAYAENYGDLLTIFNKNGCSNNNAKFNNARYSFKYK